MSRKGRRRARNGCRRWRPFISCTRDLDWVDREIGYEMLGAIMNRKPSPNEQTMIEALTEAALRHQGYPIARGSLRITAPGKIAWTHAGKIESLVIRGEVTF